MTLRTGNYRQSILLNNPPARWLINHLSSVIRKGQQEKFIIDTLEVAIIKINRITGSSLDKRSKVSALKQTVSAVLRQVPHNKDYKAELVKYASIAMVETHSFEEALLFAGQSIADPLYRNDILLEVIDKMFYQGMQRGKVVGICQKVAGRIPGMHRIISDIYVNYPEINEV